MRTLHPSSFQTELRSSARRYGDTSKSVLEGQGFFRLHSRLEGHGGHRL